jgi:quercetin dioxygenase-like cupin family protein
MSPQWTVLARSQENTATRNAIPASALSQLVWQRQNRVVYLGTRRGEQMYDQEISASQVKADRFPFPCEGDITLAVRNKNYALGPVMLHIVMKPGSVIPAHLHEGVSEALYVVEGEFINEGKKYLPGTSLHARAGKPHGPHSTEKGCKLLLLWTDKAATQDANLNDFVIAKTA